MSELLKLEPENVVTEMLGYKDDAGRINDIYSIHILFRALGKMIIHESAFEQVTTNHCVKCPFLPYCEKEYDLSEQGEAVMAAVVELPRDQIKYGIKSNCNFFIRRGNHIH